jgi:urease accessory protein
MTQMKGEWRMHKIIPTLAASVGVTVLPAIAHAHTGVGSTSGFGAGILHPLGGIDHLLAMVTVGLLAGIAGGRARWALPLGFVTAMLAGAGLALAGGSLPLVETLIAASVVVFGALAALRFGLPTAAILAVVTFFAVFHGFAHGQEAPAGGAILAYIAGFTVATALLHAVGVGIARVSPSAVRIASTVALILGVGIVAGLV